MKKSVLFLVIFVFIAGYALGTLRHVPPLYIEEYGMNILLKGTAPLSIKEARTGQPEAKVVPVQYKSEDPKAVDATPYEIVMNNYNSRRGHGNRTILETWATCNQAKTAVVRYDLHEEVEEDRIIIEAP